MTTHPENILERMTAARWAVASFYNSRKQAEGLPAEIDTEDTYVVWFCKTLQNWKALVSTTVDDGMYYECTYNGDKGELYVDAYKKIDNVTVKEEIVDGHETQIIRTQDWVSENRPATTEGGSR